MFLTSRNSFNVAFLILSTLPKCNKSIFFLFGPIPGSCSNIDSKDVFDLFNLNIDFFNTSQIYFTSQIIGLLSFVPGGMIVTEAGLFGLILKTGNDMSIAAMLVLLIRILTFWFPMFIGFITLKFVLAKR